MINKSKATKKRRRGVKGESKSEQIVVPKNLPKELEEVVIAIQKRSLASINVVKSYLESSAKLLAMAKDLSTEFDSVLNNLATNMRYHYMNLNTVLMRVGDAGDNFYILLSGEVEVLIAKDKYMSLTISEYKLYLARLFYYNELELLHRLQVANSSTIKFADEELDFWDPDLQKDKNKSRILLNSKTIKRNALIPPKNKPDANLCSTEQYLNRFKIESYSKSGEGKLNLMVYTYIPIVTLGEGTFFGEVALKKSGVKRTATIITQTECHFGYLTRTDYMESMNALLEEQFEKDIEYFTKSDIFRGVYRNNMRRKYIFMFVKFKRNKGDSLLKRGADSSAIYFVRKGNFEYHLTVNMEEIDKMIEALGGPLKASRRRAFNSKYDTFEQFYKEKRKYKMATISDREVVGLEDCKIQGVSIFNAEVISAEVTGWTIDNKVLSELVRTDYIVKSNRRDLIKKKRELWLNRLLNIRESQFKTFETTYSAKSFVPAAKKQPKAAFFSLDFKLNPSERVRQRVCSARPTDQNPSLRNKVLSALVRNVERPQTPFKESPNVSLKLSKRKEKPNLSRLSFSSRKPAKNNTKFKESYLKDSFGESFALSPRKLNRIGSAKIGLNMFQASNSRAKRFFSKPVSSSAPREEAKIDCFANKTRLVRKKVTITRCGKKIKLFS